MACVLRSLSSRVAGPLHAAALGFMQKGCRKTPLFGCSWSPCWCHAGSHPAGQALSRDQALSPCRRGPRAAGIPRGIAYGGHCQSRPPEAGEGGLCGRRGELHRTVAPCGCSVGWTVWGVAGDEAGEVVATRWERSLNAVQRRLRWPCGMKIGAQQRSPGRWGHVVQVCGLGSSGGCRWREVSGGP